MRNFYLYNGHTGTEIGNFSTLNEAVAEGKKTGTAFLIREYLPDGTYIIPAIG